MKKPTKAGELVGIDQLTKDGEDIMATEYGFVYVLQNEAMNGYYKVGMTRRPPHQRAEELSAATGVPMPFKVVYYAEVENPVAVERHVHSVLDDYRAEGREFFRCRLALILEVIRNTGATMLDSESDYVFEVSNPGTISGPRTPLHFESSLYSREELEALSRKRLEGVL